jgi:hypothetical protein
VFQAYVQAGLAGAAAAAFEEDDGQEEEGKAGAAALDERLSLAAVVGCVLYTGSHTTALAW